MEHIKFNLDDEIVDNLAMLSGILDRSPSEIVAELLDAAYPNHLVKRIRELPRGEWGKHLPIVTWERLDKVNI